MIVADLAGLDRDIGRAMTGVMTFATLWDKWVFPLPPAKRPEMIRYIAERVHDTMTKWAE